MIPFIGCPYHGVPGSSDGFGRARAGNDVLDGGKDTVDAGPGDDRCIVDVIDVVTNCETVIRVPAGG